MPQAAFGGDHGTRIVHSMSFLQNLSTRVRVCAPLLSVFSLVAVVLSAGAGTKWT
jgi:hypothetical protein